MNADRPLIRSVIFDMDGSAVLEYALRSDIRQNGLVRNHVLSIPVGQDYDDELEAALDGVIALLDDVLEDFDGVPIMMEPAVDDDDEDDDDDDEDDED